MPCQECVILVVDDPAKVLHVAPRWLEAVLARGYGEEKATELLAAKDLPDSVKNYEGNRRIMAIVKVDQIPPDRTCRDAWEFDTGIAPRIWTDRWKAKVSLNEPLRSATESKKCDDQTENQT